MKEENGEMGLVSFFNFLTEETRRFSAEERGPSRAGSVVVVMMVVIMREEIFEYCGVLKIASVAVGEYL